MKCNKSGNNFGRGIHDRINVFYNCSVWNIDKMGVREDMGIVLRLCQAAILFPYLGP